MMTLTGRGFWVAAVLLVTMTAAIAGPLEDANRLYRQGDYTGALRLIRQAEREQPNDPQVYQALGTVLRRTGDTAGARDAWDRMLELDPQLRTVRDDQAFLRAYQAVGGTRTQGQRGSSAIDGSAIITALTTGNVYVHPDLKGEIDPARLDQAARSAAITVKIVALPSLPAPYRSRRNLASDLRERLNLGEGVVLVATDSPRGVSASSGRLGNDQLDQALKTAGLDQAYARGGLTELLAVAARAVPKTVVDDRRTDTNTAGTLALVGIAGVGGVLGYRGLKKKQAMDTARQPVEALLRKTLDNLSYVDGYLDLLPAGAEAERARSLRQSAYEQYAQAGALLREARKPDDMRRIQPMLQEALDQLEECRVAIDKATGGTGVAMSIPELPSLATDAERAAAARLKPVETVQNPRERDEMQRAIDQIPESERGVSFFSGRPMPMSELIPVTIVIQGEKRQVLATRDEAEAIRRGETPQIRAFDQDGRQVPWYENRNYDPYRDYYGGWGMGGFGSLVNLYLLTSLFGGGMFGGWGHGTVINNNYYGEGQGDFGGGGMFGGGAAEPVENTGDFDLFDQSDSGFDVGGADFGGGDFGGGDFGGSD